MTLNRSRHMATRSNATTRMAQVESLSAAGKTPTQIAEMTGATPGYVQSVLRIFNAFARPVMDQADCAKHLKLIHKANNGMGFPVLNLPPVYRVAA